MGWFLSRVKVIYFVLMITYFYVSVFCSPYSSPPFSLPYYFISPYLFFSSPPNVLSRQVSPGDK